MLSSFFYFHSEKMSDRMAKEGEWERVEGGYVKVERVMKPVRSKGKKGLILKNQITI